MSAGRHKRLALVVFAVFVVGAFVVVAAAQGIGEPSVPDGDVAVVEEAPDGTITSRGVRPRARADRRPPGPQGGAGRGRPAVPAARDAAVSDLLLARWVLGEAEERGIEVTDARSTRSSRRSRSSSSAPRRSSSKFLEQLRLHRRGGARADRAAADLRARSRSDVLPEPSRDGRADAARSRPTTTRTRPVRAARDPRRPRRPDPTRRRRTRRSTRARGPTPPPKTWEQVAEKFSIDEATKGTGGCARRSSPGQSEPALDEQIFAAPEGELVGPFETDAGFYVIQVESDRRRRRRPRSSDVERADPRRP